MATATQSQEQQTSENSIELCIPSLNDNKKLSEVYSAFCGLINSHGGSVTISLQSGEDAKDLERRIRQKFKGILGLANMRDVITKQSITSELSASKMSFKVEGMSQLCTLQYNIYIPTELQIIALGSANEVQRILQPQRIIELDDLIKANDYHKVFVYGKTLTDEPVCLESKTRQFKLLKAAKANRTTLADRMTKNNKFANTISAFANHRGGHVYYGIDDDGIVYGEYVKDTDEINKIIAKVRNAIEKIIWLSEDETFTLIEGEHWNIVFEPVIDEEGREIPQTFVIVFYISYCSGGVFATVPESYQIVDGKVVHIPFQEWNRRLLQSTSQICLVGKSNFRTPNSQKNYYDTMEKMMDLRNRDKREDFTTFVSYVKRKFKSVDVRLSTLSQEATYAFRSGEFDQAEKFIQAYDSLQPQCEENMLIPESMGLYIKSANKRARRQYQESYELAKQGLQTADMLTPGLIQAWFCTHIALLANILANKESDTGKRVELVNEAKCLLGNALSLSNHVKDAKKFAKAVVDLQQKVYIHLSQLYLGLSLDGLLISSCHISTEDVRLARKCLSMVAELERERKLNPSREVQYLLARSALLFREYKLGISTGDGYFKKCYKAIELATDNKFKEMMGYCKNLKKSFEESD